MTQPLFVIEIHCIRPSPIDEAEQTPTPMTVLAPFATVASCSLQLNSSSIRTKQVALGKSSFRPHLHFSANDLNVWV